MTLTALKLLSNVSYPLHLRSFDRKSIGAMGVTAAHLLRDWTTPRWTSLASFESVLEAVSLYKMSSEEEGLKAFRRPVSLSMTSIPKQGIWREHYAHQVMRAGVVRGGCRCFSATARGAVTSRARMDCCLAFHVSRAIDAATADVWPNTEHRTPE